jgi:hypothetical protein
VQVSLVDLVESAGSEREQVSQLSQMGERRIYTPSTLDPKQIPALREIALLCVLGIGAHDSVDFVRYGHASGDTQHPARAGAAAPVA